jgi:preprotein translocase subunit YajC
MTTLLPVFAEDPPPPAGPFSGPMAPLFILALVMLFIMIVIMPAQSRRAKREQEKLLAGVKRGTKVLTNAGIIGVVVSAKEGEDEVVIRSEDTRLRIKRNVIVQLLGSDEAEAAKG